MTRALRAGIVGGGFMAGVHARSIRVAGGTLAGVAGSSAERGVRIRDALGATRAFPSAHALIADPDIDVVHVCTPNATHAELASAALQAGKHVVCEKPLATDLADARALVDLAARAGVVATVPFVYRFHPMGRHLRERVADGRAGRVFSVQGAYVQDWMSRESDTDWRTDRSRGGASRAFADIGSHLVDLLEFVLGDRIVSVSARTRTVFAERAGRPVENEDLAAVLLETATGTVGTLLVSQVAPGRKNALTFEIAAAEESLRFEQESPDQAWIGRRDGSFLLARDPALGGEAARLSAAPAGHPLGYLDAFAAFVGDTYAAVEGASPPGLPTFADGLRAMQVTEAVLASAAAGSASQPVEPVAR